MDIEMVRLICPECGYEMDIIQNKDGPRGRIIKDTDNIDSLKCPNCNDVSLVKR
jgi:predicted RNA-binding Zn-ribbon protein involved in translation (DUF1610 family)